MMRTLGIASRSSVDAIGASSRTRVRGSMALLNRRMKYDVCHIRSQKKLAGRGANQLARCPADAVGELRIVHCARQDQRPNQGRGDAHRLVVGCAPTPLGELALD